MAIATLVFALFVTAACGQDNSDVQGRTWGLWNTYGTGYNNYYSNYPYYGGYGSDYDATYGTNYNYGSYGSYGTYGDYNSGYYRDGESAPVVEQATKVKRSADQADTEPKEIEGRHRPGSYGNSGYPTYNRYPSHGYNQNPSQFYGNNRYPSNYNNRYPPYGSGYHFDGYQGNRPYSQRPGLNLGSTYFGK